jgi:xanthine dehydrogenase accessory factor
VLVVQQVADAVQTALAEGRPTLIARVIELKGFSTLPVDELIAIEGHGRQHGDILGRPGAEKLGEAAAEILGDPAPGLRTVTVSIHGPQVAELGLACGGQAGVLLQPAAAIPAQLWSLLKGRAPVALLTRVEGAGAGPAAVVVDREGKVWGAGQGTGGPASSDAVAEAVSMLSAGRSGLSRLEDEQGAVLVEAWVPPPRLVVVGSGEVVDALEAQAGLLGWEVRATGAGGDEVHDLLDWAGATAALIVLSHDPHVDAPALELGLQRHVAYVGAMGSRGTQSRRLERLAALGIADVDLDRIHRPIGLNLGGRRAPEVALAIVAEILACHHGRDARSLKETAGAIHG